MYRRCLKIACIFWNISKIISQFLICFKNVEIPCHVRTNEIQNNSLDIAHLNPKYVTKIARELVHVNGTWRLKTCEHFALIDLFQRYKKHQPFFFLCGQISCSESLFLILLIHDHLFSYIFIVFSVQSDKNPLEKVEGEYCSVLIILPLLAGKCFAINHTSELCYPVLLHTAPKVFKIFKFQKNGQHFFWTVFE